MYVSKEFVWYGKLCTNWHIDSREPSGNGGKKLQYTKDLSAGLKVGTFKGLQGITNPPYSRIPVQMWMEPALHMALGSMCDTANIMQSFIMARIYNCDKTEYLALVDKK